MIEISANLQKNYSISKNSVKIKTFLLFVFYINIFTNFATLKKSRISIKNQLKI